jgi:hypothetical protein
VLEPRFRKAEPLLNKNQIGLAVIATVKQAFRKIPLDFSLLKLLLKFAVSFENEPFA